MENVPLGSKKCVPCEGGTSPITGAEAQKMLAQVPEWANVGDFELVRRFSFPDFKEALAFTDKVGALAEEEGHHPDIYLSWGSVEITLSTHSIGGLSENDFILAAKIDLI